MSHSPLSPAMPSSPSSSAPEKDHGTTPQQLTPRSKVKAMLAAIDDESDQEAASPVIATRKRPVLAEISSNVQREGLDEEQEDEEADSPVRPRGRLASRLYARAGEASTSEGHKGESAYARIKRQLLDGATKNHEDSPIGGEEVDALLDAAVSREASPLLHSNNTDDFSDLNRGTHATPPRRPRRKSSPGLFLTPESDSASQTFDTRDSGSDDGASHLPRKPQNSNHLLELVARKKAERQARQAEEDQKKADKRAKQRQFEEKLSRDASACSDRSEDDLGEMRLTQSARPTRKASKKALEEMSRETQRMNRNMQLAHQAKTKKKISKDSLFARFNFRTSTPSLTTLPENPSSSTSASFAGPSDTENQSGKESPPTSPIEPFEDPMSKSVRCESIEMAPVQANHALELDDDDLPQMADVLNAPSTLDKGKARALDVDTLVSISLANKKKRYEFTQRPVQIRLVLSPSKTQGIDLDSDSDVEKSTKQKAKKPKTRLSKLDDFHRRPADKVQDARSLLTLRALAHLNNPNDRTRGGKPSMNVTDMSASLQKHARIQALEERKAKIDDLKARGILIQTAEEREKGQAEVEDMLEKARREADELQQKEKKAAKKERIANGETGDLDTSDDDEDYNDGENDDADIELSGSDEEEAALAGVYDDADSNDDRLKRVEDEEDLELDDQAQKQDTFLDQEAEEDDDELEEALDGDDESEAGRMEFRPVRPLRTRNVIEDDQEDDVMDETAPKVVAERTDWGNEAQALAQANMAPAFPGFGALGSNDLSFGMTQAFAATMAEIQGEKENDADEEQDSVALAGPPPEPDLPLFFAEDSQQMIPDSQHGCGDDLQDTIAAHQINLQFSQSQLQHDAPGATQLQREATNLTEIPEPTQDAGFVLSSPAPERFVSVPPSTVDTTIIARGGKDESPVARRRGRLVRKEMAPLDSDGDTSHIEGSSRDAFSAMKEKRMKRTAQEAFDKKKSDAKGMVEEQAQESEDEYAGLGGASDDESGGEEDQYVKEMMDHGEVDVDEGQLAALHANKERASDEKAVEKLFKDINNGGLRRKRGAEFDLSDSEDDAEARRRRKQREFAKMRKALLADEKVGEIAEDPKKLAFLRAIEDREDDEDLDFLDRPVEDSFRIENETQEADSQAQQVQEASQDINLNKRKHLPQEINPNIRLPATARRTTATTSKKPSTLAEIRESVSFLIEHPAAYNVPDPSSSASEAEDETPQATTHRNPRRTGSANKVIDRLSLKRTSTTSSTSSNASSSRLAYHNPAAATDDAFKVPSLLRRATTSNLSEAGADKHGISTYAATERAAGGGDKKFVRKGGSKKCSVNYFAREMEKQGVVAGVERRRREERERRAKERRSGGLRGLVGVAGFD